jgi:hypothetical protein
MEDRRRAPVKHDPVVDIIRGEESAPSLHAHIADANRIRTFGRSGCPE